MIKDLLQEGFVLKSQKHYKHAIEAFYKALELDGSSLELLLEIADIYYLMQEEEHALNYIELVLEKSPSHLGALKLLKKIFVDKNALKEVEKIAKNIFMISNQPDDLAVLLSILNKQKLYSEVLEYQIDFEAPSIFYEKSYANMCLNKLSDAMCFIEKALELDPENPEYLLLKGKILFKSDRKDECVELAENLRFNNTPDCFTFLGHVKQYQKDYKSALNYFNWALKKVPSSAEYNYNCGSTYFKTNDIKNAQKYYNLAISLDPNNSVYHFALANLYYSQKQYKRALEELDVNLFEARLLKAIILFDTGYLVLAKKEFEVLAQQSFENDVVQEYLSKIKLELDIS